MGNEETQLLIKANLFINASNNVETAKNLFKECKRTIDESNVILGASLFSQLKNKINDSDKSITNLINRIENTKQSLMDLDPDFSNEYMTIIAEQLKNSSIDTSTMTEEERNEYNQKMNNTIKDYNFNLFYMLERLQKNGQLTPEIEKMIEQEYGINYNYQKAVCEQYKIQDQMSGVDVLSDDFKSLYKEYIEQGKNVILFDPKLDENTKQTRLNELETQYNETIKYIDESQKVRTQARQQEQLQKLQLQKEYNNGLFHPGVEKEIDDAIINLRAEMGDQSAIDYLNMSDFEKGLQYAGTVCVSTFEGFIDLGEGLVDGGIYLCGKVVQVGSFGHVDDKWAEDIISYDVSGNFYDWTVDAVGINSEIAYGSARTIGNFAGGGLGYYALSAVPCVGPALCALAGAGKKTEENMIYQLETTGEIDDGKVLLNFAVGAVEGYGAGKAAGSMREGVKNLSQIKGVFSKEGLKTTMTSAGDIAKKAAVRTFTKDVDAWLETAAVVADDIYTGFETGEWNWGKMYLEASGVMVQNFIGNFGVEAMGNYQKQLANQKADWNTNLDSMTPEQRSKYWEDYFGSDVIDHSSGIDIEGHNGVFIDPEAAKYNQMQDSMFEQYKRNYNDRMNLLSDSERAKVWEQEISKVYGTNEIEHTSGIDIEGHNGIFVDPDSATNLYIKKNELLNNAMKYADPSDLATIEEAIEIIEKEIRFKVVDEVTTDIANSIFEKKKAKYLADYDVEKMPEDVGKKLWSESLTEAKSKLDQMAIDDIVIDRLEGINKKMEYSINNSGAYKDSRIYYEDTATGSNGALEKSYIEGRELAYKLGASRDGYVSLNSTYSDWKIGYVAKTIDGIDVATASKGMSIGEIVEVNMGSIGEPGKTQYVSASSQYTDVASKIHSDTASNSTESKVGTRFVDRVGEVNGLPSNNATTVAELTFERPEGELMFSHNYSKGANSQVQSAGLPVRQLPDGTIISMYEGVIPSVSLKEIDISDLNMKLTMRDINTGNVTATCEFFTDSNGKTYMRRVS